MTVIQLLTVCPRQRRTGGSPFGVFSFPDASSAPAASASLLIKNATSINLYNVELIIALRLLSVNQKIPLTTTLFPDFIMHGLHPGHIIRQCANLVIDADPGHDDLHLLRFAGQKILQFRHRDDFVVDQAKHLI